MRLRHVSEFLYCPVIFGECEEDAASCDCSYHENMRVSTILQTMSSG